MTTSKAVILILVNIVLLIAGMFIDPIAALLLLAPILIPLGKTIGMDPLHMGTMIVFNLMLGNLTPPVGITLIITTRFAGISLLASARAVIPYFLLGIVVLGLITAFPWFSLFLPNLVFGP